MRKRLMTYRKRIDALLDDEAAASAGSPTLSDSPGSVPVASEPAPVAPDWDAIIEEHLVQISFFQHERLIHLLVTLAFALMEIAAVVAAVIVPQPITAALMILLLVLLVPYIVHYYFLENETQKLYAQYDRLLAKARQRNV